MAVLSNTQDISKADNSLNLFVFPVNSNSDHESFVHLTYPCSAVVFLAVIKSALITRRPGDLPVLGPSL